MKIFVLIIAFATLAQSNRITNNNVKTPAKRAILGHGHIETAQNSISNPNKNAYLPPPIQQYPVEQSKISQQSAISSPVPGIELPASNYLPPFKTSPTQNNFQGLQNGFVPVTNTLGSSNSHDLQSQYGAAGYLPPSHDHKRGHTSHQFPPQQPSHYRAPDYVPPVPSQPGDGTTSQVSVQNPHRVPEYLPPLNHDHHNIDNSKSAYNAPGYLPPLSRIENNVIGEAQQSSEGSNIAAGFQLPHEGSAGYTNPTQHVSQATHEPYNTPGYLPPVSHQSISARVPTHVDFAQPANDPYKAAGYLPPVSGSSNHEQLNSYNAHHQHGQGSQVPHTIYGTPKLQAHTSIYVSPSVNTAAVTLGNQYAPTNGYSGTAASSHGSHSNSAQESYDGQRVNDYSHHHHQSQIQHQQQTYNAGQQFGLSDQSYSAQNQFYSPKYDSHTPHQGSQVALQSAGNSVPHEYAAPLPMFSSNPTSQYAAEAPTYQTNNGYLPPHTNLLPPSQHHDNHHGQNFNAGSHTHSNNGYLPPIGREHISEEYSGNDIQFSANQIQNTGSESSQQQYANSFPTYSNNHDGYDYSKPNGASFEDGHNSRNQNYNLNQNTIIPGEPQPDLHPINVANEGGHQQEIKIIRIIDETKQGELPNIRTLRIIKETGPGEPNHSSVQTIRIISEPSSSLPASHHASNLPVQTHVSVPQVLNHPIVPQAAEQHHISNLQASRSESAGENVEGGYLPPPVVLQPPVIVQPVITPPIPQPPIEQHLHLPQVHHPHISQVHHQHVHSTVHHSPPVIHPSNHNQLIPPVPDIRPPSNVPEYLPPSLNNVQQIRQPGHVEPYLPPIQSNNPTSNVKVLRILHDSKFDQQQDAIYAGVAEQNNNEINTIRVIHQQEAATSGRYGYQSPQKNSIKLLRYYRRY